MGATGISTANEMKDCMAARRLLPVSLTKVAYLGSQRWQLCRGRLKSLVSARGCMQAESGHSTAHLVGAARQRGLRRLALKDGRTTCYVLIGCQPLREPKIQSKSRMFGGPLPNEEADYASSQFEDLKHGQLTSTCRYRSSFRTVHIHTQPPRASPVRK